MANLSILYWRDIPAQVIVKSGRKSAKRQLSDRFQKSIDVAAMRSKAHEADSYLDQWHRRPPQVCGEDLETEADLAAHRIEADFSDIQLEIIARNGGYLVE